ncbi:hypothetical protein [Bacillus subtilis]|uniref:hypothetical protein n=1 Tax=Bacillus subtilis TaxID=1423 RepID=UPI003F87C42A
MKKRSLLMPSLAALLLVPVAPVSASETPRVHTPSNAMQAKLATSQAMDTELEVKKLKELGQDPEKLQFKDGQSLEVKFDDGSRIVYSLEITPTSKENLPKNLTQSDADIQATYKTYTLRKQYFYVTANANISVKADIKHEGRSLTVRRAYHGFQGTFAKNDKQSSRIIRKNATSPKMGITETSGQFTLYAFGNIADYYTRSYVLRMDIDTAGFAVLRVMQ